jgi:hypothetical protein
MENVLALQEFQPKQLPTDCKSNKSCQSFNSLLIGDTAAKED